MTDTTPAAPLPADRVHSILRFLKAAQDLKDTMRSGRTAAGAPESVAAHSWSLCLLAILLESDLGPVNMERLLKLCVIHDLGEVISGDIPAIHQEPGTDKTADERRDFHALTAPLPDDLRTDLREVWEEYARAETREARLAKGLDKIETMVQHVTGAQAPAFDYLWNLGYGRTWTDADPALAELRREVDAQTKAAATSPPE